MNWNQNKVPTLISVILYRYNYIDYRLLTLIKNELAWNSAGDGSILVSVSQLKMLIELNYQSSINLFRVANLENRQQYTNSIYFIWQLINNYPNLKWFIFTLDNNANYTRVFETNQGKVLRFAYRFMQGTVRLTEFWDSDMIRAINPFLVRFGLLDKSIPYKRVLAQDLIAILDGLIMGADDSDQFKKEHTVKIIEFLDKFDDKFEKDNPNLLLITDYLD